MSSNGANGRVDSAAVLICDDTILVRTMLKAIIGNSPALHVVGEATNGNEVVAEAKRLQPDVVLLDLAMPHRTGLEALPDLRRVAPDAKIIVFSGFATTVVGAEVIALGATCYLEKGADPDKIIATIQDTLTNNHDPRS